MFVARLETTTKNYKKETGTGVKQSGDPKATRNNNKELQEFVGGSLYADMTVADALRNNNKELQDAQRVLQGRRRARKRVQRNNNKELQVTIATRTGLCP